MAPIARKACQAAAIIGICTLVVGLSAWASPPARNAGAVSGHHHRSAVQGTLMSPIALGLNTAPWDAYYLPSPSGYAGTINSDLKAAHIGLIRYGGGSWADYYDWQTNTSLAGCEGPPKYLNYNSAPFQGSPCDETSALDFATFSEEAKQAGAGTLATVNYGSGSPALAAAWVANSLTSRTKSVAMWEIGNETYGCWEVDQWLSRAPEHFDGYKPDYYATCPQAVQGMAKGTETLALSYAANALPFIRSMKAVDPSADIGVPWLFGPSVEGGGNPESAEWNDTVLGKDGSYVGFVDAHYYPFEFSGATSTADPGDGRPSDHRILQKLEQIPELYKTIRSALDTYAPNAKVVIGETGISGETTTTICQPVSALFAAGDALSWLSAGAASVDWWDMNNYGSCTGGDLGMFTSPRGPTAREAPEAPYAGYLLASKLTRTGARLRSLPTSDTAEVIAFQSILPDGQKALAFINTSTRSPQAITFRAGHLDGPLTTWTYSGAGQNSTATRIAQGTTVLSDKVGTTDSEHDITLPAESILVLESRTPNTIPPAAPLTISSNGISPDSALTSGGTSITITGTGFAPGAYADFGSGHPALGTEVLSPTQLRVRAPDHAVGTVDVTVAMGSHTSNAETFTYTSAASAFFPLKPARICDTRSPTRTGAGRDVLPDVTGQCDNSGVPLAARKTMTVQVTGLAGVPAGATAILADVVTLGDPSPSYLSIYPAGTPRPTTSQASIDSSKPTATAVLSELSPSGRINIYNHAGNTEVVIDVEGYIARATRTNPGTLYRAIPPARICDTRSPTRTGAGRDVLPDVTGQCDNSGVPLAARKTMTVQVTGLAGVPGNATAVYLRLAAVTPLRPGYATVFPKGSPQPLASQLNYAPPHPPSTHSIGDGVPASNVLTVPLHDGEIRIFASATTQLVIDVEGYLVKGRAGQSGSTRGMAPVRVCDTRPGNPSDLSGAALIQCAGRTLPAGSALQVQVSGPGLPIPKAALDAIVTVTATAIVTPGALSLDPPKTHPALPIMEWGSGTVVTSRLTVVPLSNDGQFTIYAYAGEMNVIVDVVGYIAA